MHKCIRLTKWCVFKKNSECDKMDTHIITADNNLVHSFPQTTRGEICIPHSGDTENLLRLPSAYFLPNDFHG